MLKPTNQPTNQSQLLTINCSNVHYFILVSRTLEILYNVDYWLLFDSITQKLKFIFFSDFEKNISVFEH